MTFNAVSVIAVMMLVSALVSVRRPQRYGGVWRSNYVAAAMAILHILFLYNYIPTMGVFPSTAWAAITAAGLAGLAMDDDADAVGALLAALGIFQVLLLAGVLKVN